MTKKYRSLKRARKKLSLDKAPRSVWSGTALLPILAGFELLPALQYSWRDSQLRSCQRFLYHAPAITLWVDCFIPKETIRFCLGVIPAEIEVIRDPKSPLSEAYTLQLYPIGAKNADHLINIGYPLDRPHDLVAEEPILLSDNPQVELQICKIR